MRACLLLFGRSVRIVSLCFAVASSNSVALAQAGKRAETKSRPTRQVSPHPARPPSPSIPPPVRMPERPSFRDEPAAPELSENEELADEMLSIPFQLMFFFGAQASIAGFDAWKDHRDPGRNVDDRYLQALIRLKDAKNPRLRQKSIVELTSIPDPSAAKNDLKKSLRFDPSPNVRKSAAVALGKIAEPDCLDYLNKAMRYDESAEVRQICALILARANSKTDAGFSKASISNDGRSKLPEGATRR